MEVKRLGLIRKNDMLGRVSPPSEFMKELGIKKGDPVEVILYDGFIAIRKVQDEQIEQISRDV